MLKDALRWGYPWLIVQWCCLHFVWAYGLIREPDVIKRLTLLVGLDSLFTLGLPTVGIALFMIMAATLAMIGLMFEHSLKLERARLMMMPQYALVFAALLNDTYVLITGINTVTGQHVDPVIVHVLLIPLVTSAVLHTVSIIERYVVGWSYHAQS